MFTFCLVVFQLTDQQCFPFHPFHRTYYYFISQGICSMWILLIFFCVHSLLLTYFTSFVVSAFGKLQLFLSLFGSATYDTTASCSKTGSFWFAVCLWERGTLNKSGWGDILSGVSTVRCPKINIIKYPPGLLCSLCFNKKRQCIFPNDLHSKWKWDPNRSFVFLLSFSITKCVVQRKLSFVILCPGSIWQNE